MLKQTIEIYFARICVFIFNNNVTDFILHCIYLVI